jgi:LPS export ABC transporter protein LptC
MRVILSKAKDLLLSGRGALPACAVLVAALACQDVKQPPVAAGPTAVDSADQLLLGVRYVLTGNGIKRGELFADTIYVYDEQTRFDLRRPKVDFSEENGTPFGTMRADRGVHNMRTQELEGWGNVVLNMADGRMLKSPHVVYKQLMNEVSSDTTFEISKGDKVYHGVGFKTDPKMTTFSCLRRCGGSADVALPNP